MSTNYTLPRTCDNACDHCSLEGLHIGKVSGGWVFLFQGHSKPHVRSRADWEALIAEVGSVVDEYGNSYHPDEFWAIVDATLKPRPDGETPKSHLPYAAGDWDRWADDQGWEFSGADFS